MNNLNNKTHSLNPYDFTFPTLDDETAGEINEFLYELVEAFEFHYSSQIRRYYISLRANYKPEGYLEFYKGENENNYDDEERESEWLDDEIDF